MAISSQVAPGIDTSGLPMPQIESHENLGFQLADTTWLAVGRLSIRAQRMCNVSYHISPTMSHRQGYIILIISNDH